MTTATADTRTLAACCRLAIDLATSTEELRVWWIEHQHAIKRLSAPQRAWLVAAKDARRAVVAGNAAEPAVASSVGAEAA